MELIPSFIVLLPLFGAMLAMPLGKSVGPRASELVTIALLVISCLFSWYTFFDVAYAGNARTVELFTWIASGSMEASWAVKLDTMSAVMLVVVTSVSSLVHIYSVGYMHEDKSRSRFFAYLSLFTFAMLTLVTADNFIQLFFGWEGVGLASYLLIGFYHHKDSANDAAMKAFIVNRVGDFGFALGIMAVFFVFGSVQFDTVFSMITADAIVTPFGAAEGQHIKEASIEFLGQDFHALTVIGILLFIGAMGKSAQFILHTWLPDAMEGPTPVSALIHAATMVTAGVFLVCRCSFIYENAPTAAALVTLVGATTAFFAATVALLQDDIKKVVAYSTCSQLGYMFFAAGVGAYSAAMFHLFTHAFFKALLFLGSGAVIHAMHHEQDMKKMGGLRGVLPFTYLMMIIGTIAITGLGIPQIGSLLGFPFGTAGFVSKDMIIESAFAGGETGKAFGYYAFALGLVAALMTSFYSWRLIFLTFHREPRAPAAVMKHPHHVPDWMLGPLVPLAVGGLFAGMVFYGNFIGKGASDFWNGSLSQAGYAVSGAEEAGYAANHAEEGKGHGGQQSDGHNDGHSAAAYESDNAHGDTHGDEYHEGEGGHHGDEHGDDHSGGHHHFPVWVLWSPTVMMLIGFFAAYSHYMRGTPLRPGLLKPDGMIYAFLKNKWYFDHLYHHVFVRGARWLGKFLWKQGDTKLIDGVGPDGVGWLVSQSSKLIVRVQSGYIYHYAFAMLIGIAVFLLMILTGGK